MVEFMESHIFDCDVCLADSHVKQEIGKISEIVLPSSKMTKAARKEANASVDDEEETVEEEAEESLNDDEYDDEDEDEDDLDPVFMEDEDGSDDME